jgi:hypothetical protein
MIEQHGFMISQWGRYSDHSLLLRFVELANLRQRSHHVPLISKLIRQVFSTLPRIGHPDIREVLDQCLIEGNFALQVNVAIQLPQDCHCPLYAMEADLGDTQFTEVLQQGISDCSPLADQQMQLVGQFDSLDHFSYSLLALG